MYTMRVPHSPGAVILGTTLLWIGWLGFNGGSALGANLRAVSACLSTTLAAAAGGVTALVVESIFAPRDPDDPDNLERLSEIIEAVTTGMVAGMVAVTPAAGYVSVSQSYSKPPGP